MFDSVSDVAVAIVEEQVYPRTSSDFISAPRLADLFGSLAIAFNDLSQRNFPLGHLYLPD